MSDCRRWKVLLVEDDADSAEALGALLDFHGIETVWSRDGSTAVQTLGAIERLGDRPPDFVLLDLNLPNTDTVQLGRELMHHRLGAPVVLLSASSAQLLEQTAGEIGAIAALRKPFSIDHLVSILEQHSPVDATEISRRSAAR